MCGLEGDEPSHYHGSLLPGGEQGTSIPAQGTAGSGQKASKAEPGQQGLAAAPLPPRKRASLPSILPARLWEQPPACGSWASIILEMSAECQPAGERQDVAGGGDSACLHWLPF